MEDKKQKFTGLGGDTNFQQRQYTDVGLIGIARNNFGLLQCLLHKQERSLASD